MKGEHRAWLEFDLKADLRPAFDWNTHMIFAFVTVEYETKKSEWNKMTIWDDRIMRSNPDQHVINLKKQRVENPITDYHQKLR